MLPPRTSWCYVLLVLFSIQLSLQQTTQSPDNEELVKTLKAYFDPIFENIATRLDAVEKIINSTFININEDISKENDEMMKAVKNLNATLIGEIQSLQSSSLDSISETIEGCPQKDGFFMIEADNQCYGQCFKAFGNESNSYSWEAANEFCKGENLSLAKPANAVALQKYLHATYGDGYYWVGGRGTKSAFQWHGNEQEQTTSSSLLSPRQPPVTPSVNCVLIFAEDMYMKANPGKPYWDMPCDQSYFPLCERFHA